MQTSAQKLLRLMSVLALAAAALLAPSVGSANDRIAYVSDGTNKWSNWDLYLLDLNTGSSTQLTTHTAIDNHPDLSPDGQWVVFSSTRLSDDFNLFLGDVTNVEGTLRQLTSDIYTNGPQTSYPDRHCHFHPNSRIIIFTTKNRPLDHPIEIASECSQPTIITPPRFFEGMNVIRLTDAGTETNYADLNVHDAWDQANYPDIWTNNTSTYVGHPSFSHAGTSIVFSGSIDGEGKDWEVYTVGFNTNILVLAPNSLRRITKGPAVGANPIKMSAGAHFSEDDNYILFGSTRTPQGNSQIFRLPVTAVDAPLTNAEQLTDHAGNDYVPEPLTGGSFIVVSDLGTNNLLCGSGEGPTMDLDIVLINTNGARQILGDESQQEMLLIADEVSWFCGLKPNLSACTFMPRIMKSEAMWLGKTAWLYREGLRSWHLIPPSLLSGYGYNNTNEATLLYALGWENMDEYMASNAPGCWPSILQNMQQLVAAGDSFPGLTDTNALNTWLQDTAALRKPKNVVASVMGENGIGAPWGTQRITFPNPGDQIVTSRVYLSATSSAGLTVTNFTVASGPAEIIPTEIVAMSLVSFTGTGTVSVVAYQPGLTNVFGTNYWLSVSTTNTFKVLAVYTPVAGDFDGDGIADPIVFYETSNLVSWLSGSNYSLMRMVLDPPPAVDTNMPALYWLNADFDGDRKADPTVVSSSNWYVWPSMGGYARSGPYPLSVAGGAPVAADFDGDRLADPGMVVDGMYWYVWPSLNGYAQYGPVHLHVDVSGVTPLAADFDGDRFADPAVMDLSGNAYAWLSAYSDAMTGPLPLGQTGWTPVAGDLDGDGLADPAMVVGVSWYVWLSSGGYERVGPFTLTAP
ncbi:MAG: PD40 domain-containing protein [Lentisphaerae bacterium]|nr:PD40 domain-containing protein [Lentisphaerota bacterium]